MKHPLIDRVRCSASSSRNSPNELNAWAARTLRWRFDAVFESFKPAAVSADEDPEYVHQLRVACRRAVAALDFFKRSLPKRQRRAVLRMLKQVRRSAGEARDVDVLQDRIACGEIALKPGNQKRVTRFLKRRRKAAQKPLKRIYKELAGDGQLERSTKELLNHVERRQAGKPFELSMPLERTVRSYLKRLNASSKSEARLHRLRIEGKELRYTLEILRDRVSASCIADALKRAKQIQDRLGQIVDHTAAEERLLGWTRRLKRPRLRKALRKMAARERRNARKRINQFHKWWDDRTAKRLTVELREIVAVSAGAGQSACKSAELRIAKG